MSDVTWASDTKIAPDFTNTHRVSIEHLQVSALRPYSRNARTHSAKQIAQIAASIRVFGFNNPVLVDKDEVIIAGHGRVMAASHPVRASE